MSPSVAATRGCNSATTARYRGASLALVAGNVCHRPPNSTELEQRGGNFGPCTGVKRCRKDLGPDITQLPQGVCTRYLRMLLVDEDRHPCLTAIGCAGA